MDGERLHNKDTGVPPECWCITRDDLKLIRKEIEEAIAQKVIKPTQLDGFDPNDRKIGPNMHTVVAQYVTPLTKDAGGMSWALLRHPQGLKCDIFITHCWLEGAFEFIDQVLASWPMRKKAAWCCIFANPQNLDISDFIREPRTSPFAKALAAASHVMVVPTTNASIYTRIWCVYEAFLAVELGKVVYTASSDTTRLMLKSSAVGSAILSCGTAVGFAAMAYVASPCTMFFNVTGPIAILVNAVAFLPRGRRLNLLVNAVGFTVSGLALGVDMYIRRYCIMKRLHFVDILGFFLVFSANEVDRLRANYASAHAQMLRAGYAGVECANASIAADKTHILAEIGDRRDEVNGSIQVLLDTGMSTSPLREAAARGVDVRGAADLRWSHCALGLTFWFRSIESLYAFFPALGLVDFALFLLCMCLWIKSDRDRKAFVGTAMAKFHVFFTLHASVLALIYMENRLQKYDYRMVFLAAVLKTFLAIAGRGGTASVPCVGPWIAQVLGPGCRLRMRPVNKAGKASSSNGVVQQQPKVDSNLHADASQGHAVEEGST